MVIYKCFGYEGVVFKKTDEEVKKKMETLKDIKEALNKVPNNILERCMFGIGEGSEETVQLICMEDGGNKEMTYVEVFEKYPDITKINNLIENVKKAQDIMDDQDKAEELSENLQQEGITDTYFDKKKGE